MRTAFLLFPLTLVGLVAACDASDATDPIPPAPSPNGGGSCDVKAAFAAGRCISCHSGAAAAARLDLTLETKALGDAVLDVPSNTATCAGRRLVDSRDPDASVLLTVVDHSLRERAGSCALTMAPGTATATDGLGPEGLACVKSWVKELTTGKGEEPFEPVPLSSALEKLKLLVHGGAVTEAELETATQDPNKIHDLVEGWTKTPEFQVKLRSFLGTALQQDSIGAVKESLGFPTAHFTPSELLRGAISRSFVDTAVELVSSGAPFTQVVTTHRRSLTTAELVLLAYSDQTSAEIEAASYKVRIVAPAKKNGVPATLTKVGNVWELGGAADAQELADGCRIVPGKGDIPDPQVIPSDQFLAMLFGRVRCRGGGATGDLRYPAPVTVADHADSRPVSLETTKGTVLDFKDLASIRAISGGSAVKLRFARPGFFGSAVFLDNWPTNQDNSYRVTLNQTLTVGLGSTFSIGDPTASSGSGIDTAHAAPETPCYGCHRLLDPMRPFLSNGMDPTYRVSSGTPKQATFAFFGSSKTGSTADDLALAIVEHPRFATAWVLRVCSWANSRACSEAEPGVADLAQSFRASGWDFRKLLVDTLSSPLVTGLSGSTLSVRPDVSIARRRHLCAALRVRLGAVVETSGVCSNARDALARGIPDDAFARGQVDLVQTSTPGMFHAAGLERLCQALAPAAVTAQFPASDVAGSTTKLVEGLMGLPKNHPRHDAAIAALRSHVTDVTAAGGSVDQSMQSAFVVACTSPDVSGAGL
jgi:hypothetical protein